MKKSLISFLLMSSFIFTGCTTNNYKNRMVNINGDIVTAEMFTKIQGNKVLERKLGKIVDK